jgi:hypothetical protein
MIRAALPQHILHQLKHLALDLGRPVNVLLAEAAVLLLRYHDRGSGLPEPAPPVSQTEKGGVR